MLGGAVGTVLFGVSMLKSAIYSVVPGEKAFKFNAIRGVGASTFKEGIHLKIPVLERPVIFNVKS